MSPWWWQIPALFFGSTLGILFMFWTVLGSMVAADRLFRPRDVSEVEKLREKGL